ncbi:hypothetical protein PUN28_005383 [Cardiocondyla obscurior]|uniref:Uncharacterized protein n=1 Tax=Cardiocondyla obscurior TaxID=286306 RepID=A0AAW2GJI0_9HYME
MKKNIVFSSEIFRATKRDDPTSDCFLARRTKYYYVYYLAASAELNFSSRALAAKRRRRVLRAFHSLRIQCVRAILELRGIVAFPRFARREIAPVFYIFSSPFFFYVQSTSYMYISGAVKN